jgi:hypothetical protein
MKVKLFGIGGKNLTNKHPFPQANCLQILVESPSILSLQILKITYLYYPWLSTIFVIDKTTITKIENTFLYHNINNKKLPLYV